MIGIKTLIAIGSVTILAAVGCSEPGTTSCAPYVAGKGAAPSPSGAAGSTPSGAAGEPNAATATPGPCPAGFTCTDISSVGGTATDGKGNPVMASCGMGALQDCNDADPKSTCPGLTNPICAHISVAGMNLVSCGQVCTP
jgi:hypothetical protein